MDMILSLGGVFVESIVESVMHVMYVSAIVIGSIAFVGIVATAIFTRPLSAKHTNQKEDNR